MYNLKSWNVLNIADKIFNTVEELRTSLLNGCLQKSKFAKMYQNLVELINYVK